MRGPTVRGRRLGAELRKLRGAGGHTLDDIVSETGISKGGLSRLENGHHAVKAADLDTLLDLYGVTDPERREALHVLSRDGSKRGWWQTYRDHISSAYADLISLEADATYMRSCQPLVIPGLLQTAAYSRATIRAINMDDDPSRTEALVSVRQARQSVLSRPTPLQLHAVIHEAALRQRVGTPLLMRDQLQRLVDMAELDHVVIQVLPQDVGETPGLAGGFTLVGWGVPETDVVMLESLTSSLYVEEPEEVGQYGVAFDRISRAALTPGDSADLIANVKKDI